MQSVSHLQLIGLLVHMVRRTAVDILGMGMGMGNWKQKIGKAEKLRRMARIFPEYVHLFMCCG